MKNSIAYPFQSGKIISKLGTFSTANFLAHVLEQRRKMINSLATKKNQISRMVIESVYYSDYSIMTDKIVQRKVLIYKERTWLALLNCFFKPASAMIE